MWEFIISETELKVRPPLELKCPFCGTVMKPHHLNGVHRPPGFSGWAVDVAFKCPNCSFHCWFGVAIDEQLAQQLRKFKGYVFKWWEDDYYEETEKRLKALGYW